MALLVIAVLWIISVANIHKSSSPNPALAAGPAQDQFCDVVEGSIRDYREAEKTGANEAGLSQLRYNRKQSLSSIMNNGGVTGWTGVVKRITTDRDGTGSLAVQLSCGAGSNNTATGYPALYATTTGVSNTASGYEAKAGEVAAGEARREE
jgi:hypothetical protein